MYILLLYQHHTAKLLIYTYTLSVNVLTWQWNIKKYNYNTGKCANTVCNMYLGDMYCAVVCLFPRGLTQKLEFLAFGFFPGFREYDLQ